MTSISDNLILPSPYLTSSYKISKDSIEIGIKSTEEESALFYTIDGSIKTELSVL